MTVIRQEDFIASVAGALQYISYYHPVDYITSLAAAYEREQSPAAQGCDGADSHQQPHVRRGAQAHLPGHGDCDGVCEGGHGCALRAAPGEERKDLQAMVDEGVRRAYLDPDNKLRASILADPAGARKNTKDNTPAVVNVELVKGDKVEVTVAAKGGGSEAKTQVRHAESVGLGRRVGAEDGADDGRRMVSAGDAGHRHRRHGGEGDAAGQGVADGPDRHSGAEGARADEPLPRSCALELYDKVNRLGIGAQGLGGLTTVLDVKVLRLSDARGQSCRWP